jgi:hypothetical protein
MATYATGRELRVAFFSGSKMPVSTPDTPANSVDVCGTFLYGRWTRSAPESTVLSLNA